MQEKSQSNPSFEELRNHLKYLIERGPVEGVTFEKELSFVLKYVERLEKRYAN